MRRIAGFKVIAFFLIISFGFSTSLASDAACGPQKESQFWIPKSSIQEPDPEVYFLLAFDVSGSMWGKENGSLAEDFQTIYLYLSEELFAVDHEAILFHETDELLSDIVTRKEMDREDQEIGLSLTNWKTKNKVKCKVEFHSENLFLQVETTFTKPFIQWTESSRKRVETRCSILFRL